MFIPKARLELSPASWIRPVTCASRSDKRHTGGRGGIRTHGTLAGTPVFKTGALNHSATLPNQQFQSLSAVTS